MNDSVTILKKEWHNFTGSEKGVFVVYGIIIFVWSFLPLYNDVGSFAMSGTVWWLFFSVIVSGNFANSVFVSERLSGSMEILLSSGFSRGGVLYGKILFVVLMSICIGGLCFALSFLWVVCSSQLYLFMGRSLAASWLLYCCGTLLNATAGAWMSIRLSSPRLIPFVNILIIGIVCGIYYALHIAAPVSEWLLIVLLLVCSVVFLLLAKKDFNGEKVIAPVDI
jgi:ABC-type Na+ efflux pump permease subunit